VRLAQHTEALGRVAGGLAHELNNVLTAINAGLELIRQGLPGDDPLRVVVERTERAASRGAALSRSMLAYGRQQFLRARDLDLNAFIRQRLPELQTAAGQGVAIDTILADDLVPCRIDAEQLLAALLGLVENARDAMPAGGRICIVTANRRPGRKREDIVAPNRDVVMLAVTDNGVGIPPGLLERVFDPFVTTKEVGEGSGLGLSMVQGFMYQSGGDIEIESTPGLGTTVRLYLPGIAADAC
jgi:signal transduction histidine kinase